MATVEAAVLSLWPGWLRHLFRLWRPFQGWEGRQPAGSGAPSVPNPCSDWHGALWLAEAAVRCLAKHGPGSLGLHNISITGTFGVDSLLLWDYGHKPPGCPTPTPSTHTCFSLAGATLCTPPARKALGSTRWQGLFVRSLSQNVLFQRLSVLNRGRRSLLLSSHWSKFSHEWHGAQQEWKQQCHQHHQTCQLAGFPRSEPTGACKVSGEVNNLFVSSAFHPVGITKISISSNNKGKTSQEVSREDSGAG